MQVSSGNIFSAWIIWFQQAVWITAVIASAVWWHLVQWAFFRFTHQLTRSRLRILRDRIRQAVEVLRFTILPAVTLGLIVWIAHPQSHGFIASMLWVDGTSAVVFFGLSVTVGSVVWGMGLTVGTWWSRHHAKQQTHDLGSAVPDEWHSDHY